MKNLTIRRLVPAVAVTAGAVVAFLLVRKVRDSYLLGEFNSDDL
jgi:hypothetical protein